MLDIDENEIEAKVRSQGHNNMHFKEKYTGADFVLYYDDKLQGTPRMLQDVISGKRPKPALVMVSGTEIHRVQVYILST